MRQRAPSKKVVLQEQIFRQGKRLAGKYLQLFLYKDDRPACPPLFCVAKKIYRSKPERNRLRRLLKEAYRLEVRNLEDLKCHLALMIMSPKVTLKLLCAELQQLSSEAKLL